MAAPRTNDPLLAKLERLVRSARGTGGLRAAEGDLERLPELYRYASSRLARAEAERADPELRRSLVKLVHGAHALLYRDLEPRRGSLPVRVGRFLMDECPRTIRAEWRVVLGSLVLFYALVAIAWVAVARDLELAYSLLDAGAVENEIAQLRATESGEPFRGNFTFGVGDSAAVSGTILTNNIQVSLMFFGSALCPPFYLYILGSNALMLGTYTAVAGHWGQAGAISSILWAHGVIEIQMIVLAGAAGLVLVRGLIAPGPWSRKHALVLGAQRSWRLVAPVGPWLVIAGLIEGFISPHAPFAGRVTTAVVTGVVLLAWVLLGGRGGEPEAGTRTAQRAPDPRLKRA